MERENKMNGWHFARWIRLSLGLFLALHAIYIQEPLEGLVATFFLFQAFTNKGCAVDNCAMNSIGITPAATTDDIDKQLNH